MRLMLNVPERIPGALLAVALLAAAAPVVAIESAASPRSGPPVLRHVRSFESDATSAPGLGGFPFPPGARARLDFGRGNVRVLALTLPGGSSEASDTSLLRIDLDDSINLAFASRPDGSSWWLLFDSTHRQLVLVTDPGAGATAAPLVHRFAAAALDVQDPQGLTIDPDTGRVFILDAARRKIVLLDRLVSRGPRIRLDNEVPEIDLPRGLSGLRGIAFDPADGHLHVLSPSHGELYELDGAGHLLALRDVSAWGTVRPDAMTFAASSRPSDDTARTSLFLLARLGSNPNATLTEWSTLEPTALATLPASSEPATLVQAIDTSAFDPPSPDPSGLEYDARTDSLLVTDGEVDEMSIYDGANVFKVSRSGRLLATFDTTRFSDEPAGLAIDPATRHCFVSDDTSPYSVYEVSPGTDGACFTGDDTVRSFPTRDFGLTDPEGAAFGQGSLFLVDGMGYSDELFTITAGPNGIFEGDEGDDSIAHCDTLDLGVDDPEGVAYDPGTGTLFVVGLGGSGLAQITPDCRLVRTIGHSGVDFKRPAGLALAPGSANPSMASLWVADRGVDNDSDSDENDGAIYELALPFLSPANLPPTVSAGADLIIAVTDQVRLEGSVADDGRPTSGPIGSTWSKVSGPGTVLFDDPHRATAYATFSAAGTYVLRLTGDDGELQASDDVTITVTLAGGGLVFETRVVAGADDAEEQPDGSVDRSSSDLDLVSDGSVTQAVGIRFHGVTVPPRAQIVEAWIQFEADETSSDPTTLALRAEAADHASPFLDADRDLSSRTPTASSVSWSPAAWTAVGVAGPTERTPDLSALIQEIVSRPGWSSGKALAIVITGTGRRVAESFEGNAAGAPLLHVGYVPVVDMAPVVTITAPTNETSVIHGDAVTLQGVATDPEDGDLSADLTWTSSLCGPLGSGPSLTRSDLPAGSHTITASVADTRGLAATASLDLTVQLPTGVTLLDTRIAAGADDAEESAGGSVGLTSSDLDLLNDGSASQRAAGLRFAAVGLPAGATIVEAWVQFQADETGSDPTTLVVQGEAADSAAPFGSASGGISTRPRTAASVSWSPAAWTAVGVAGPAERTPDLSALIQEIVRHPGWSSGNALAIVITGTGRRVAESFEGSATGAALLHVGYTMEPNSAPVVTITAPANGTSVTQGDPVTLQATATDAEDGDLSAGLSWTSNLDGTLGSGASLTLSNLSVGVHTITVSVVDHGGRSGTATVSLTVQLPPGLAFLDTRIAAGADDAEESAGGSVGLTSSDLDLLNDGSASQRAAGLRFPGVGIPRGATIVEAWVQFQADETSSDPTALVVQGEAADNAVPFGSTSAGISSRPRTTASVSWGPAAWPSIGAAGPAERTFDLSAVIQEIVNRPGWSSGNALAIVITGTGRRVAESFEGSAAGAPLLHVGYSVEPNSAPSVTITSPVNGTSVNQGESVTLQATATDAEDGDLSAGLSWTSNLDGPLGSGASLTRSNLSVGVHTITASVVDHDGHGSTATLSLTVKLPGALIVLDTRIVVGADDAEESDSGSVGLTSSDLDLLNDGSASQRAAGLRFPGVGIPRGATIVEAWVQFQADETSSDPTALVVQGEAADNAAPFGSTPAGISSRSRTTASVSWGPAAWPSIGAAGPAERTSDLSAVIQEIVNRPGWSSGNALAIVITGTGRRVAESFEGSAAGAPLLHLGYVPVNMPPVVTITAPANGTSVNQGDPVALQATATDAEGGDLSASLTWTSDRDGPLGSGASLTLSNLSVGVHTITASVADARGLHGSATLTLTVALPAGLAFLDTLITVGADDAEESDTGTITLAGADLDLTLDVGSLETISQTAIGLRFPGLGVPRGATIVEAWVQFQADETGSDPTSLVLQGEATDNAAPFGSALRNISSRPRTAASASWSPAAWTPIGAAGPAQRTSDLSAVIREIVNRPGWSSGNALAIVITGTGRRVAESFEGNALGAPLLHVGYVPVNSAPIVTITAPANGTSVTQGDPVTLQATATDAEDGDLSAGLTWTSNLNGPLGSGASLTRSNLSAGVHTITASVADTRGLRASATLTLTVALPAGLAFLDTRIAAGADDAEESDTGSVGLTSSDLDLLNDGSANQRAAGLRFPGIALPRGATIVEAWVQFQADETSSDPTSLVVQAEAADNAAPFGSTSAGISSRPRTAASVSWSPAAWSAVGTAGPAERTPDLSAVIQEIVSRPGWSSGNALAIVISGTGRRVAESFEGSAPGAPLLHVGYVPVNAPPVVTITAPANGTSVTQGDPVTLQATAIDAEDGDLSAGLTWTSDLDGPLGSGASLTLSNLSVGVHTITASVADARGLHGSATLTLTVALPAGLAFLDTLITVGADDAEESDTGTITLAGADLDLTLDVGSLETISQTAIGLRFPGLGVPRGATIVEAWVQFQADETGSDPTSLVLQGEAADNAAPFGSALRNISSRPRTAASASWSPAAWTPIGAAGPAQRTSDLSVVIREIVNRPGWSSGNALAIVITGTGRRVAESFEGNALGAPLLHVGYVANSDAAPIVMITSPGNGTSVTQGDPVTLQATATDAEDGDLSAGLTWTSNLDGPLGSGASLTRSDLSVGVHTITASVVDHGGHSGTATLSLSVKLPGELVVLDTRIAAGADDAEESVAGTITLASSDLDMTLDVGSVQTVSQTAVGLRFGGVSVPRGARIIEAWVQFQADETGSDPTALVVQGEAADNAVPFGSVLQGISSRTRTAATVSWNPAAWTPIGAIGIAQRTPDLSAVIQEIVGRPGWSSGNALAIVITGTGRRVAESFEGTAPGAPLLHVGYLPEATAAAITTNMARAETAGIAPASLGSVPNTTLRRRE